MNKNKIKEYKELFRVALNLDEDEVVVVGNLLSQALQQRDKEWKGKVKPRLLLYMQINLLDQIEN